MLSSLYTWTRGSSLKLWVLEVIFSHFHECAVLIKKLIFTPFSWAHVVFSKWISTMESWVVWSLSKEWQLDTFPPFSRSLYLLLSLLFCCENMCLWLLSPTHGPGGIRRGLAWCATNTSLHEPPLSELICDKASRHSISWGGCEDYLWWLAFSTENSADGE